jgi:PAS domain S-box-containing protein
MAPFAANWAAALHGAGAPAADVAATERSLTRLVDRLARALTADPFRPETGHEVGAELFGIQTDGAAGEPLGATVACLVGLPDALGLAPRTAAERMPLLLGALVTGYTAALRACTLEDLEAHTTGAVREARARAAERALREEQARYRAVLSGVEIPVAVCEPGGRFVDANAAFVDLLRHRVPYLRSHTLFDVAHPEDAPMLARVVDRDLVHGRYRRVRTEVRLRRRSGTLVLVPLALSVTRDGAGDPAYLVVAATPRRGGLVTTATPDNGIRLPGPADGGDDADDAAGARDAARADGVRPAGGSATA